MTRAPVAPDALAIALNPVITNDPCALCGERCDPDGVDFFLRGTRELVCDACALCHAPDLWLLKQREPEAGGEIPYLDADDPPGRALTPEAVREIGILLNDGRAHGWAERLATLMDVPVVTVRRWAMPQASLRPSGPEARLLLAYVVVRKRNATPEALVAAVAEERTRWRHA